MLSAEVNDVGMAVVSGFMRFLRAAYPGWERGFFRLALGPDWSRVSGSCVVDGEVELISMVKHSNALGEVIAQAKTFLKGLGQNQVVALFVVNSTGKGSIELDDSDLNRWEISMLDGATGIPEGF